MSEKPLSFYVAIDPTLPKQLVEPVVAWGDFESEHPGVAIYDGDEATRISSFYVDLLTGRPLSLQFVTRRLDSLACLLAVTLFLDRSLALSPKIGGFLSAVNLVSTLGASGMAHVERDLARLLVFLDSYLLSQALSKKEMEQKLSSAIQWVREYILEERLPSLPPEQEPPTVLDSGTNGFVLAQGPEKSPSLILGVVELYRQGYLRGVLFCGKHALAFRKSRYLRFEFDSAANQLNQAEEASGGSGRWTVQGGLFLSSPPQGTNLSREALTSIFLRN
jgi:hypothetical protein